MDTKETVTLKHKIIISYNHPDIFWGTRFEDGQEGWCQSSTGTPMLFDSAMDTHPKMGEIDPQRIKDHTSIIHFEG